jgi:hypothetical protein
VGHEKVWKGIGPGSSGQYHECVLWEGLCMCAHFQRTIYSYKPIEMADTEGNGKRNVRKWTPEEVSNGV